MTFKDLKKRVSSYNQQQQQQTQYFDKVTEQTILDLEHRRTQTGRCQDKRRVLL
jgi:hypothetical protein